MHPYHTPSLHTHTNLHETQHTHTHPYTHPHTSITGIDKSKHSHTGIQNGLLNLCQPKYLQSTAPLLATQQTQNGLKLLCDDIVSFVPLPNIIWYQDNIVLIYIFSLLLEVSFHYRCPAYYQLIWCIFFWKVLAHINPTINVILFYAKCFLTNTNQI